MLLHAAEPARSAGGFLGVDMLFVVAAALVTRGLLDPRHDGLRTAVGNLWSGMSKRWIPPLTLVLVWTSIYGRYIADGVSHRELGSDGVASLLHVVNWRFADTNEPISGVADASLFHQLWSLAVAAQWLLLWLLVIALSRRIGASRRWRIAVGAAALAGAIASVVAITAIFDTIEPARAFFGTDTRAVGLFLGAATAVAWPHVTRLAAVATGWRRFLLPALSAASLAGLTALVASGDEGDAWLYRLGPLAASVAAAILLVAESARPRHDVIGKALASPAFRRIGEVGLELYVWHWPVLVYFDADRTGLDGAALALTRLAALAALGTATHFLVVVPLLKMRLSSRRLLAGTAGAAAIIVTSLLVATSGPDDATTMVAAAEDTTEVFIVGDSSVVSLLIDLDEGLLDDMTVQSGGIVGCGILPPQGQTSDACEARFTIWEERLSEADPDYVLIPLSVVDLLDRTVDGRDIEFGSAAFSSFAARELDRVIDTLDVGEDTAVRIINLACRAPSLQETPAPRFAQLGQTELDARASWLNDFVTSYAETVDDHDVAVLDAAGLLCPSGTFEETLPDGLKPYRDGMNFSGEGSLAFWQWVRQELGLPPSIDYDPVVEPTPTPTPTPAPTPTPGPSTTAYVIGDSVYLRLVRDLGDGDTPGVEVVSGTLLGCGVLPRTSEASAGRCDDRLDRWRDDVETVDPNVVIVGLSELDLLDHNVGSRLVPFGSEEFRGMALAEFDRALDIVDPEGTATVKIVTIPCPAPISFEAPFGDLTLAERAERATWLNELAEEYASSAVSHDVDVLDASVLLCSDGGALEQVFGADVRDDGSHFTAEGSALFWSWLLPQLGAEA